MFQKSKRMTNRNRDYARQLMINILRDTRDKVAECYAKERENDNSNIY